MKVKKLKPEAIILKRTRAGDAGFDVYSLEDKALLPGERYQFKLGLAVEIPANMVMVIQERSGMAIKQGIQTIGNVIDSNYRGEISAILLNTGTEPVQIKANDRIAQALILFQCDFDFTEVDELTETNRGTAGYGSSGN